MSSDANAQFAEIRIAGKTLYAPSAEICGRTVVVMGKWIKTAQVKDEEVVEGSVVEDPELFISKLKERRLKADIFTFSQKPPRTIPEHHYHLEWDNWAAISTVCFKDWWDKLPQESRKNVRRASKRGVTVRVVPFNDDLVEGVHKIYNATPIRQGKRFWHFGKDINTVRRELATYLDRSEFIGAYWNDELIGFLKMVYVDRAATLFHIIAMNQHHDKRPMNALIAKAVEFCEQKGKLYFIYGQFIYGRKHQSPLLEFKRRNGFEQINFPRYYVPLTVLGAVFVRLRLYKGVCGLLPESLLQWILKYRAWWTKLLSSNDNPQHNKLAGVAQR